MFMTRVDNMGLLVLSATIGRPDRPDFFLVEARAATLDESGLRSMIGADGGRASPIGVDRGSINLVCTGAELLSWEPDLATVAAVPTEGQGVATITRERQQAGRPSAPRVPR